MKRLSAVKPGSSQWTPYEDKRLVDFVASQTPTALIAEAMGRTIGAIHSRKCRLGISKR